jgi:Protein of unknown function (DUF2917)
MRHALEIQPTKLPARAVQRLENAKGQQITALDGVVWITQANDPRDIVLTKGQSFLVERNGRTVVFALKDAAVTIGPQGHIAAVAVDLKDVAA